MTEETKLVPELDLARIRRYCAERIPARVAHLVRLEIDVEGRSITILECRPPWSPDMGPDWTRFPIARLRFTASRREWTLYWRDQHQRFHRYVRIDPSPDVGSLLAEIEADPTAIFWAERARRSTRSASAPPLLPRLQGAATTGHQGA